MTWFIDLMGVVAVAAVAVQLHLLRQAFLGRDRSVVDLVTDTVQDLADVVVGPQPVRVLSDENLLEIERERYDTMGAQSGHIVNASWLADEEREAFDEQMVKDECSSGSFLDS